MKNQTLILLLIAGACGLVAMLGVKQYLDKQNNKEEVPQVAVLKAMVDIPPGTKLNDTNTAMVTVDAEDCPDGVVTDPEQIVEMSSKVHRSAGDWIFVEQLSNSIGATTNIPKGYRVMTIPVDATTNHSGMLEPGHRIDLFLTYQERDQETGDRVTKVVPVLEYIEVFAVDATQYGVDASGENANSRNISLLVTIDQLLKLQVAKEKGKLSTMLRNSEDTEEISVAGADESNLFGGGTGGVDETSSTDNQYDEPQGFSLPPMEMDPKGIAGDLMAELGKPGGASGPVQDMVGENEWVMAIHSTSGIRVEHVSTESDVPVDTRGGSGAAASPLAAPIPGVADPKAGGIPGPPGGMDLEGLGEMAEELLGF